ncbi:uncharacterized protein LOC123688551, partial [Harmonia axyridis]|uniref:uncharacterized protein LOC123688551 n=1 Tax=Harmonia axyridis TaxID=115357 RepID=UPI001E2775EA
MSELNVLIKRRGVVKAQLTRFESFLKTIESEKAGQIPARLEKCKELWNEFENLQIQIEELDINHPDLQEQERIEFQDAYFESIALADTKISQFMKGSLCSSENSIAERNVKLPTMQIPEFQGSYKNWLEFYDSFNALIHTNTGLTDIQKFYYLKNALKGDAAEVIRSLEVSSENYKAAWSLLKTRFENKKMIALNHIESLHKFPPIMKESYGQIRKFLDEIRRDLRALRSLGQPVDHWDTLLIFTLEAKLDPVTRREWQKSGKVNKFASMEEFLQFLEERCVLLETIESNKTGLKIDKPRFERTSKAFVSSFKSCAICKENHPLFICKKFLGLSINERRNEVKRSNCCRNCLQQGHWAQDCKRSGCRYCGNKHNTLLHAISQPQKSQQRDDIPAMGAPGGSSHNYPCVTEGHPSNRSLENTDGQGVPKVVNVESAHNFAVRQGSDVLLSTAIVYIAGSDGKLHRGRMLLDSGSQSNFVTREFAEKLNLSRIRVNIPVVGIGNVMSHIKYSINMSVHSRFKDFKFNSTFLVIEKITDSIPTRKIDTSRLNIPKNINLADESFAEPDKIDGILGVSIFWDLICAGQINLGRGEPSLQKTRLGWIIAGQINGKVSDSRRKKVVCNLSTNVALEEQIQKFWELEEFGHEKRFSKEEAQCEQGFRKSTKRNQEGRFVVELPFRTNIDELGESFKMAHRRLMHMERKLEKTPQIKEQYHQFMREYIEMGHMSKVNDTEFADTHNHTNYLPHHGVYKEDSLTTKCRVVFDGSAATSTGVSLNNVLMVGPQLQDTLFSITLRFRKHNVVITADIEKMFRQVLIKEEHRDLQRILWRFSAEQSVETYKLNTITYGTGPASYLAVRCLQQLAHDCNEQYPEASRVILKDFYMDDLLSGAQTVEQARVLKQEIDQVLQTAGFILRKWTSNMKEVFSDEEKRGKEIEHYIAEGSSTKTLGLLWNAEEDTLHYKIKFDKTQARVTKRTILGVIAQIFDPLGLVGPVIMNAKIIMQQLWKSKLDWDESLPLDLHTSWVRFSNNISELSKIKICRHVICANPNEIQLHAFAHASMVAYGAAAYIRSTDAAGVHHVHLLCAKSKVAPLKVVSLPRLELCAALLAARLVREIKESMGIPFNKIQFWSDSKVTLAWIHGESSRWKTFVANRTSEIQELTGKNQWAHVISGDNPADIISRGIEPGRLGSYSLWWHGPSWLSLDEQMWPEREEFSCDEVPEQRIEIKTFFVEISLNIFDRFSSFVKLHRVWAYCLRFIRNCRRNAPKVTGSLSVDELVKSTNDLIKLAQGQTFQNEIEALRKGQALHKSSRLIALNPFLDSENIIRVGGRLQSANIPYDQKHQIVLPIKHNLTNLIIRHEHNRNMHLGAQALLSLMRLKYWVLSGRSTVRKVEACLNSRPLTPLSDDPLDLNVLTPGHFLIGSPLLSTPQEDLRFENPNRIKKYYHLKQIVQHFWTRWSKDYLSTLQGRTRWRSNQGTSNMEPGTMVLLKEDNSPPQKWDLARIIETHP